MPVLWIILNSSNLRSFLVLILASVKYESLEISNITDVFVYTIAIINPIAITQFFETISTGIFDHMLPARSNHGGFLVHVFTYFGTVETNGKGILQF